MRKPTSGSTRSPDVPTTDESESESESNEIKKTENTIASQIVAGSRFGFEYDCDSDDSIANPEATRFKAPSPPSAAQQAAVDVAILQKQLESTQSALAYEQSRSAQFIAKASRCDDLEASLFEALRRLRDLESINVTKKGIRLERGVSEVLDDCLRWEFDVKHVGQAQSKSMDILAVERNPPASREGKPLVIRFECKAYKAGSIKSEAIDKFLRDVTECPAPRPDAAVFYATCPLSAGMKARLRCDPRVLVVEDENGAETRQARVIGAFASAKALAIVERQRARMRESLEDGSLAHSSVQVFALNCKRALASSLESADAARRSAEVHRTKLRAMAKGILQSQETVQRHMSIVTEEVAVRGFDDVIKPLVKREATLKRKRTDAWERARDDSD